MNGNDIRLADGTILHVKVNFYTMYLINQRGMQSLSERYEKENAKAKPNEKKLADLSMEMAKEMIYVILRSNGVKVDEEEAMMMIPMDAEEVQKLFEEFAEQIKSYKKKEVSTMSVKP